MITETDLRQAIAECHGTRNPNANTCMKLASYYTILDHIVEGERAEPEAVREYSYKNEPMSYHSGTEFCSAVEEIGYDEAMAVVDELMTTLAVINPRLYASVMRKMKR